jgi:hypothetical protein
VTVSNPNKYLCEQGDKMSIKSIMKEFDFEKVHEYMVATDWKWSMDKGETRVPTVKEMKKWAKDLLKTLRDDPEITSLSSGGFTAELEADALFNKGMRLSFVIATSYDESE